MGLIFDILITFILSPLFGICLLVLMGKESKNKKVEKVISIIFYPTVTIIFLLQAYILSGWSAYMSARADIYTQIPFTENDWLYYVFGFIFCAAPLVHTCNMESHSSSEFEPIGTYVLTLIALIMYVVFAIWPNLIMLPYNWVLFPLLY